MIRQLFGGSSKSASEKIPSSSGGAGGSNNGNNGGNGSGNNNNNNTNKIIPKLIGLDSVDDVSKNITSGEIVLPPNEYANFWKSIRANKSTCSRYLARIVVLLISIEKDASKREKLGKKFGHIDSFVAILLNTIQYIDMFVGFEPTDQAFQNAMKLVKEEKLTNPRWNNAIYQGLIFLDRRRGQREVAAKKMVVDSSTLESEEEMKKIGVTPSTNMTGEVCYGDVSLESAYLEFPFTYTVLTKMSRTDVSEAIFDEVLNLLEQAGNTLSSMAGMQGRTLALMFMLRELLTISPTNDQAWLHRACEVLIGMYKWPTPYGILAKEVLDFISLERRSPGCHLRDRILSENPQLQPIVIQSHPSNNIFDAPEISPTYLRSRSSTVYLFLDLSQPLCCTHKSLLLTSDRPRSDTLDSNVTAKHASTSTVPLTTNDHSASLIRDILLHIFELDFHLRDRPVTVRGPIIDDPLGLAGKEPTDVLRWYCSALKIVEKAKSLPATAVGRTNKTDDQEEKFLACSIPGGLAKMYRESKLAELLREIAPGRQFSPRRSNEAVIHRSPRRPMSRPSSLPSPIEDVRHVAQINRALSSDSDAPCSDDDFGDHSAPSQPLCEPLSFGCYAPSIPDMTFQVYDVGCLLGGFSPDDFATSDRLDTMTVANSYNTLRNEVGYVHFVQDTNDLFKMINDALQEQQQYESHWKTGETSRSKYIVRVVLMGSDTVLHRFLCAYVVLLSQRPEVVQSVQLELFLTPVGKNKLGNFLARSDKWYRRQIYDSFKGPLGICPQYPSNNEITETAIRDSDMLRASPVTNLKKLLEDYVRQATNAYPISVFEVLCWAAYEERPSMDSLASATEDIFAHQQTAPDIVIPFMMQIDIGLRTQVEQYRMTPIQANTKQSMQAHYEASLTSMKEILLDKDFQMSSIELSVSYVPSTMTATESLGQERPEVSKSDHYATLSFNNFPMTSTSRSDDAAERNLLANAPHLNFLVMNSQPCKAALKDAYFSRSRNINGRGIDTLVEALANSSTYDPPQPITAARVDVVNPRERFHILVDGCVYGPFRRIVIRSCQVGVESSNQSILTLPVMTYIPIATI